MTHLQTQNKAGTTIPENNDVESRFPLEKTVRPFTRNVTHDTPSRATLACSFVNNHPHTQFLRVEDTAYHALH